MFLRMPPSGRLRLLEDEPLAGSEAPPGLLLLPGLEPAVAAAAAAAAPGMGPLRLSRVPTGPLPLLVLLRATERRAVALAEAEAPSGAPREPIESVRSEAVPPDRELACEPRVLCGCGRLGPRGCGVSVSSIGASSLSRRRGVRLVMIRAGE